MGENNWEMWEEALACDQKLGVNSSASSPGSGAGGGLFCPENLSVAGSVHSAILEDVQTQPEAEVKSI